MELSPPQAFLLREEGVAGRLGDGHHQDEGKMTCSGDGALVQKLDEAI